MWAKLTGVTRREGPTTQATRQPVRLKSLPAEESVTVLSLIPGSCAIRLCASGGKTECSYTCGAGTKYCMAWHAAASTRLHPANAAATQWSTRLLAAHGQMGEYRTSSERQMRLCLMQTLLSIAISESELTCPVGLCGLVAGVHGLDRCERLMR